MILDFVNYVAHATNSRSCGGMGDDNIVIPGPRYVKISVHGILHILAFGMLCE